MSSEKIHNTHMGEGVAFGAQPRAWRTPGGRGGRGGGGKLNGPQEHSSEGEHHGDRSHPVRELGIPGCSLESHNS